jgi:hypothetical protein
MVHLRLRVIFRRIVRFYAKFWLVIAFSVAQRSARARRGLSVRSHHRGFGTPASAVNRR